MSFEIASYAWSAWTLDKYNSKHCALLRDILKTCLSGPGLAEFAQATHCILTYTDLDDEMHDFGGHQSVLCDFEENGDLSFLWRGQEVARTSDVAYDDRRGRELLTSCGAKTRTFLTQLLDAGRNGYKDHVLDWELVGIDPAIVDRHDIHTMHKDVAPWHEGD